MVVRSAGGEPGAKETKQASVSVETTRESIENGRHVVVMGVQEAKRKTDRVSTHGGGNELLGAGTGGIVNCVGVVTSVCKYGRRHSNREQLAYASCHSIRVPIWKAKL